MYETITTNLMVKSVGETMEFYKEILGFQKVLTVPEEGDVFQFAILKKDNVTIMLQDQKNLVEEYPSLEQDIIKPSFTLFVTVTNVQELYKSLQGKVTFAKELHSTFYGKDEFAIFDNNKNILTISE